MTFCHYRIEDISSQSVAPRIYLQPLVFRIENRNKT
ncbi:GSCOCG00001368001-RA-CDS [Cotesia congregata]|nr:GSCOCG00001368001-RA-CDS [Cotesia congregata]